MLDSGPSDPAAVEVRARRSAELWRAIEEALRDTFHQGALAVAQTMTRTQSVESRDDYFAPTSNPAPDEEFRDDYFASSDES